MVRPTLLMMTLIWMLTSTPKVILLVRSEPVMIVVDSESPAAVTAGGFVDIVDGSWSQGAPAAVEAGGFV